MSATPGTPANRANPATPATPATPGAPPAHDRSLTPHASARPTPMDPSEIRHRKPPKRAALLGVLAWIVGLLFALPVFWMVLTSFHKETDAAKNPPDIFAPLSLEGYQTFFAAGPWPSLLNSLTASVISTILVISHLSDIKDEFPTRIDVVKGIDGSLVTVR